MAVSDHNQAYYIYCSGVLLYLLPSLFFPFSVANKGQPGSARKEKNLNLPLSFFCHEMCDDGGGKEKATHRRVVRGGEKWKRCLSYPLLPPPSYECSLFPIFPLPNRRAESSSSFHGRLFNTNPDAAKREERARFPPFFLSPLIARINFYSRRLTFGREEEKGKGTRTDSQGREGGKRRRRSHKGRGGGGKRQSRRRRRRRRRHRSAEVLRFINEILPPDRLFLLLSLFLSFCVPHECDGGRSAAGRLGRLRSALVRREASERVREDVDLIRTSHCLAGIGQPHKKRGRRGGEGNWKPS